MEVCYHHHLLLLLLALISFCLIVDSSLFQYASTVTFFSSKTRCFTKKAINFVWTIAATLVETSGSMRLGSRTATVEGAQALFAIHLTRPSNGSIKQSGPQSKQAKLMPVFSARLSHQRKAFAHAECSNWSCVGYTMSKLGEVCNMKSVVVKM